MTLRIIVAIRKTQENDLGVLQQIETRDGSTVIFQNAYQVWSNFDLLPIQIYLCRIYVIYVILFELSEDASYTCKITVSELYRHIEESCSHVLT